MQVTACIANTLWTASNLWAYLRFRRAVRDPRAAQAEKLRRFLTLNAGTAFGRAHGVAANDRYEAFARRVPLSDYAALEPWITRIRQGEREVLTREPVTHLIPTSGSTGGRKLIPFTAGLQKEFNAAIAPWLVDLQRRVRGLIGGPAYWSVTPALQNEIATESSVVPIGFDADTAYLSGARRLLADAIMAVPPTVQRAQTLDQFRERTLRHLLRCRELRLISVWHPSFLSLLLDALPMHWEKLLRDIADGNGGAFAPLPRRAAELRAIGPRDIAALWPRLAVISCWGDGNAELAVEDIQRRFPGVPIQRKGLLATEGVVTIPFVGQRPLAINSHFFEFIDDDRRICLAEELRDGGEYEIVVTTAGGLWRYRLGDRVRVRGWVGRTPALKFLGRAGSVSDRRGEKLSELFVAETLSGVFGSDAPLFALLAPDETGAACHYTLYVEGACRSRWAATLDRALRRNPHYALCRDLGQLEPARIFRIAGRGFETFAKQQSAGGVRLGEVKPAALSRTSGWSKVFAGGYVEGEE